MPKRLSPQNEELARKVWKIAIAGLKTHENPKAKVVLEALQRHKEAVIRRIAIALDIMRPDPREHQGTIVIKVKDSKKEKLGLKLRFKAIDKVEVIESPRKKWKQVIWVFFRWDLLAGQEGWRFQAEIDLTGSRPRLIRNIIRWKVESIVVY